MNRAVSLKQSAQGVAFSVGQVLRAQERIAEGQARGDAVFPRKRRGVLRPVLAEPGAAAAPEAVRRRTVDGADFAPVVEIFPGDDRRLSCLCSIL